MRPEDDLLLLCARQHLEAEQKERLKALAHRPNLDWQRVFDTAKLHSVAPLVYAHLVLDRSLDLHLPEPVEKQFRLYAYRNNLIKEGQARALEAALRFFQQKSLPVLLIKGAVLDLLVYEQPWYTELKDLDLIVHAHRTDLPPNFEQEVYAVPNLRGIEFDFYSHHDLDMNGALPVHYERIWREACPLEFRGLPLLIPTPEDLLISLCINSCRKRFFRLKSICDIGETLRKYPQLDWRRLGQKAQEDDVAPIVYAALWVVHQAWGASLPPEITALLGVHPALAALIRFLIAFLQRFTSLASYHPTTGFTLRGRQVHPVLLLAYATYRPYQMRHKVGMFAAD